MRLLGPSFARAPNRALRRAVLFLALAACELPRPEGTFTELEASLPDASIAASLGRSDAMVAAPAIPGGLVTAGGTQGGGFPGANPGGGTPGAGDAGGFGGGVGGAADASATLSAAEQALRKLEGRYLMRMDMFSTATVTSGLISLSTSNRVSHLIATQLFVENGQLKGFEQLCHQTFAHRCTTKSCSSLSTTMSPVMTDFFVRAKPIERSYVLSNGMLEGRSNTLALGYDATTDAKLPTVPDNRVWDPVPGNTTREGLLLALDLAALKNVRCDVYTTQIFISKILATKLAGTADAPVLQMTPKFGLDTSGSDGATLGSNSADCKADDGAPPSEGEQYVRFARVEPSEFGGEQGGAFWNCPTQDVWDKRLPATAP
jgi:hypothetical protein